MKRPPYLALALGLMTLTAAGAASASVTASSVVISLRNQGYRHIDVTTTSTQIVVDAWQNGVPIEITYDKATGQIVHESGYAAVAAHRANSTSQDSQSGDSEDDGAHHHHRRHRSGGGDN